MKNGEIYTDENGKKWIWLNGIYFEHDDRPIEEIKNDFDEYLKNNMNEIVKTYVGIAENINKNKRKYK